MGEVGIRTGVGSYLHVYRRFLVIGGFCNGGGFWSVSVGGVICQRRWIPTLLTGVRIIGRRCHLCGGSTFVLVHGGLSTFVLVTTIGKRRQRRSFFASKLKVIYLQSSQRL